jgi:hypothetical protein
MDGPIYDINYSNNGDNLELVYKCNVGILVNSNDTQYTTRISIQFGLSILEGFDTTNLSKQSSIIQ